MCLYDSIPDHPGAEARSFADHFMHLCDPQKRQQVITELDLRYLGWDQLGERYSALFRDLAGH